jgi:hypothetical protein
MHAFKHFNNFIAEVGLGCIFGEAAMNAPPDLRVRLSLREAMNRIGDASYDSGDVMIAARLKFVMKELEDILAQVTPDHAPLLRAASACAKSGR